MHITYAAIPTSSLGELRNTMVVLSTPLPVGSGSARCYGWYLYTEVRQFYALAHVQLCSSRLGNET